ncbi:MAG: SRPBCC family protein [Acetobacteraceae bacterium]|nr:SRPBCC family protein [Acetobacteraceae bacterium]
MPIHAVRHLSTGISRPFAEVYAFLAEPENFPKWASGLGHSFRHLDGMEWLAETPMGPMRVRFSERNPYGVLDHTLLPEDGEPMHNPMRVVANGDGSEVVFTLFRRPGMSDADFARDADWVLRDLQALKALLEG